MDTYTTLFRKLPSLTIAETPRQWHSQGQRFSLLPPYPLHVGWLQRLTGALLDSPYTSLIQPNQVSLLDPPQVSHCRVSDVQFHKAIYSWHINTETAPAVLYQQSNGWAFIPSKCAHRKFLLFLRSPPLLLSLLVSIHLAATTFVPFVNQSVGSSQPLVWGSHPEHNLHLNFHLANRATSTRCIPQHLAQTIVFSRHGCVFNLK